jgi:anti-sigma B factor antagonist
MTAVPTAVGTGVQLICDGCGDVAVADGCGLHDAEVVYVAVSEIGWTGSAFARGPHRCPGCETPVPQSRSRERRPAADAAATGRVSGHHTSFGAVVRVVGDLDIDVVDDLRVAVDTALEAHARVIVDLSRAATIDSVGLSAIVRARQSARRRGGDLLLAAPSRFVRTVLHTMRLDTAFPMFDSVPQAMSAVLPGSVPVQAGSQRPRPAG